MGRKNTPKATASTPSGMFTKNSHSQDRYDNIRLDIDGPAAAATETTMALIPKPKANFSLEYISFNCAKLTPAIAAADMPCTALATISIPNEELRAQKTEDRVKNRHPPKKTFLYP